MKKGFALATTLILLTLVTLSTTTVLVVLSRSLKMTRVHAEALRAFYIAEAGKAYAMWKTSPLNTDEDAAELANCLAKNESCPSGLNRTWSYALPGDEVASFTVTAVSDATPGEATIESRGSRAEGAFTARRRTEVTAFKPIRQIEQNDQAYSYAILGNRGTNVTLGGALRVTNAPGQAAAGIHSNQSMNLYAGTTRVGGPITAPQTILMQEPGYLTVVEATMIRGGSCNYGQCNNTLNEMPMYCWGSQCPDFVGEVTMPGIDINSARPDSYKSLARTLEEQNPGQKYIYNNSEIDKLMNDAYRDNTNGGWVDMPGPITYVNGSLRVTYTQKLRIHGILVVQGDLAVGWADRPPYWNCNYPTCQPNVHFVVTPTAPDGSAMIPGLITNGSASFAMYVKEVSVEGLIYAQNGFYVACTLEEPISTKGVIITREYSNLGAFCNPNWQTEGLHNHVYDASNLQLLFQGPRAVTDLSTSYTGHWEEEY